MCNPGGAAALLGLRSFMERLGELPDASLAALEQMAGHSLGVIRISLGLATVFEDIWRIIEFAREVADDGELQRMLEAWRANPSESHLNACATATVH
jgi:molybdenum cofactor sulfurtransferase